MPSLPRDPIDRLAETEARLARAEAELLSRRRRNAEWTAVREVFPARTVERTTTTSTSTTTTTGGSSTSSTSSTTTTTGVPTSSTTSTSSTTTTGYPPCCDAIELPIATQQLLVSGDDLTSTDRWVTQLTKGLSRIGWLPPDLRVWVAHDRDRFVILDTPEHLHGVACCAIPAAYQSGDDWILPSGTCVVFRETTPGRYAAQRYADGTPVKMTWHNGNPDAEIPAGPLLTAELNADGKWVVNAELDPLTTSTSTTTTTAGPVCSGTCKWIWSASLSEWVLDTDGCAPSTTSTSTSTTSTTTTSGGSSTSSTSTTSSTTTTTLCGCDTAVSTSSTTTTTPNCQCLYPTQCGDADGECTFTGCSPDVNAPPDCVSTSSTSTTTCDCATTTTPSGADCQTGCDWVGVPGSGGWSWSLVSNGCSSVCPCPAPTGDPFCATDHTECVYVPPPPPPPPPPGCTGSCTWWWVPTLAAWVKTADDCSSAAGCACRPPTISGNVCAPMTTPCAAPVSSSTTTTTAGPCAHCYTSSTTTTTNSCAGSCKWDWELTGPSWTKVSDPCGASCPCLEPAFSGQADCEVAWTPCAGTSTTTTSTTTTTAPCTGNCVWECFDDGGGYYNWYQVRSNCQGGCAGTCGCYDFPSTSCHAGNVGAEETFACRCSTVTTTTTTSTTSSSTSSSTTSSSTTSTTTTTCGCSGGCTWYCNGSAWVEQGVPCTTANGCITCECNNYPATVCDGAAVGSTVAGSCVQTTTTTSTS